MAKPDFTLEFVKEQSRLVRLSELLSQTPAFALDIETVDWWNRQRERIALIQIAFRYNGQLKVAVIDALAGFSLEALRLPIEQSSILKIIHNAAFDTTRLAKHFNFHTSPIYDTMLAARRAGEKRYSLQAQSAIHLNLRLEKSARQSDWSRRPLESRQLYYAALDSYSTLLLYENQRERNLYGEYRLKSVVDSSLQNMLPLDESTIVEPVKSVSVTNENKAAETESTEYCQSENNINSLSAAVLGIVTELPTRYSPAQLSVSLGAEQRVGLAGWIVDNRLGKDVDLDEETVKMTIADLCERKLLRMTETRRLIATEEGVRVWQQYLIPHPAKKLKK